MSRILCLCLLLCPGLCQAVVITDFGMTFDKMETMAPDDLVLKGPKISNPAIPLGISEVGIDGSTWSSNGDPVIIYNPADPLGADITISGFDSPLMKIHVDVSCVLEQPVLPDPLRPKRPLQWYDCDITSIAHVGPPTVLGTPVTLESNMLWVSTNGAYFDSSGDAHAPYLGSGSATGTKVAFVNEPSSTVAALAGFMALVGAGLVRAKLMLRS